MRSLRDLVRAAALVLAAGQVTCATPPVYEKLGGTDQDFYASKQICVERSMQPHVIPECQAAETARPCRIQVNWDRFDACMAGLGWKRVQ